MSLKSFSSKKTLARRSVSKSPDFQKRKPLVTYPLSPRNKVHLSSSPSKSSIEKTSDFTDDLLNNAIEITKKLAKEEKVNEEKNKNSG